jgi:type I restriction enzyme S subunit
MIDLSPIHTAIIKQILEKELPNDEVIIFGSRANGTAKPYSDIDLAVISENGIDKNKLWELREAFEESDLPFCVDVLDWNRLSKSFQDSIKSDYKKLI